MDVSSVLFQTQDSSEFLFDCKTFLEQSFSTSDAGYYSACSSLSPASSTDSCCFSPETAQESFPEGFPQRNDSNQKDQEVKKKAKRTGRPRSKFPGLKRQNASEREKLRMRDLTKALHHLRAYLPASVVPVGQTLTKIETLRLTIRYISYLSAQLQLGQEEAAQLSAPQPSAELQMFQTSHSDLESLNFDMSYYQKQQNICSPEILTPDYWVPQREFCFYTQH